MRYKSNNLIGRMLGVVAVVAVCLAGTLSASAQNVSNSPADVVRAFEQTLVDTIARAESSVVAVSRIHAPNFRHLEVPADGLSLFRRRPTIDDPSDPDFVPSAFGAGVIIDPLGPNADGPNAQSPAALGPSALGPSAQGPSAQGLILTHSELVREGDTHWVTTADRQSYLARLVGADPRSGLAVLSIEASGLNPIRLGDASKLSRGTFVVALGNPFSIARDGQVSASWGIVANTGRKARFGASDRRTTIHEYGGLIQTDAKLNLGTSGGPILNLRGEMVGLSTSLAAAPGFETAAGYAIPVDAFFRRALNRLKQGREVEYGLLGVQFWPRAARPASDRAGVRVSESIRGGPAHRAGLRANDVITHVNNHRIANADDLIFQVSRLAPKSHADVQFVHARQSRVADVQLSKGPVRWVPVVTHSEPSWRGIDVDFSTAIENYGQFARDGLIDEEGCVVVRRVEHESTAWRAGLRKGMFISHVAGNRVREPNQFHAATAGATGSVELRLTLPENQGPIRLVPDEG